MFWRREMNENVVCVFVSAAYLTGVKYKKDLRNISSLASS